MSLRKIIYISLNQNLNENREKTIAIPKKQCYTKAKSFIIDIQASYLPISQTCAICEMGGTMPVCLPNAFPFASASAIFRSFFPQNNTALHTSQDGIFQNTERLPLRKVHLRCGSLSTYYAIKRRMDCK